MKLVRLIVKNLLRNLLLSSLTCLGTMVLVLVVTLVWSVLSFLDAATSEKSRNLKGIVTERWQLPSQMPYSYAAALAEGGARQPGDVRPDDSMTWQFYGGTLDPAKLTREGLVFAFALEPNKLATMMDGLDDLSPADKALLDAGIRRLETNRQGLLLGRDRLKAINKRVGERIKIHSINFKEIDLEFEIVGIFPEGRYDQSAAMNREYLNEAIDNYARRNSGRKHAMANKSLNLVWFRVADTTAFAQVADQIMSSPSFSNPAVKCETASSGIASFMESYRDLIWGMRWLLSPAILFTLSLVLANAISISVRERRMEMAMFKVLGFRPGHILFLVLGEAVSLGVLSGLVSTTLTYLIINNVLGGVKFPIAFFPAFNIPLDAIWWGPLIGGGTALAGSIVPAWSACRTKVSQVFSMVD